MSKSPFPKIYGLGESALHASSVGRDKAEGVWHVTYLANDLTLTLTVNILSALYNLEKYSKTL